MTVIVILVVLRIYINMPVSRAAHDEVHPTRFRCPHASCASSFPFFVKSFPTSCKCVWCIAAGIVCWGWDRRLSGPPQAAVCRSKQKHDRVTHAPRGALDMENFGAGARSSFLAILPSFFSPLRLLACLFAYSMFFFWVGYKNARSTAAVRHKTVPGIRLLAGSLAWLIYSVIGVATRWFAQNSTAQHGLLYTRNAAC